MTYDDTDSRCQYFLAESNALQTATNLIAFVTVIDDNTQLLKRYFGSFSREQKSESIRNIIDIGGKWPLPFREVALPDEAVLFD